MKLFRRQRVDVELAETAPPAQSPPIQFISRAERAHYRPSWEQRLVRNARRSAVPEVSITLFGIPDTFSTALRLISCTSFPSRRTLCCFVSPRLTISHQREERFSSHMTSHFLYLPHLVAQSVGAKISNDLAVFPT
jgi:hypothetical protein